MIEILESVVLPTLYSLFTVQHLGMIVLGVIMGLVLGILPGLGGIAGLSLVLPFTFGMEPSMALAMMIGLLAPLNTSDTLPAILMGIPGSAGGQTTVLDGFPMARRGEAARALSAAFTASMMGGLFGALVLTFAVFGARPIILSMGFGELMMVTVFALTMVGTLTGKSTLKGIAACALGLLLGTIGGAPATGEYRMTFDILYLAEGIPLIVLALGLFAFPEVIDLLRRHEMISQSGELGKGWLQGLQDTIKYRWLVLRTSMFGAFIGMLPGLGTSAAEWMTYGHVVQTSRDKSQFGKGDVRTVIGVEGANNAVTGGSLVPTLLFGIPGSGTMAILLGGFVIIGIQPGPSMVSTNLDITFTIIWSLAIANVLGAGACFLLSGTFARVTTVRYVLIAPIMMVILFFGVFQATRLWSDLIAFVLVGIVGVYLKRFGWPRPALLVGFVLSGALETSVYRAMQVYGWSFLQRPVVILIAVLTIVSVVAAVWTRMRVTTESEPATPGAGGVVGISCDMETARPAMRLVQRLPQLLFTVGLLSAVGLFLIQNAEMTFLGRIFPLLAGSVCLVLIVAVLCFQSFSSKERTVMNDEERCAPVSGRGILYFVLWFVGALGAMAVLGLPLGATCFILAFTTVVAGGPLWRNILLALAPLLVFSTVGLLLRLRYPPGLVQQFIALPGWLG